ncbi:MAG: 1-acyl-sn-glycerol-3-phosphate acyltransferase [Clostridia bacterium]|nr:1-acyl-sn-glycerol-3-phosphate acyltransferase [Clostridia bacterium]
MAEKKPKKIRWGKANKTLYAVIWHAFRWLFIAVYRMRIEGAENLPKTGRVVLCGNHRSFVDPILMIASVRRELSFMAKKSLFEKFFLSWLLPRMGAFPVDRTGTQLGAVRIALSVLENEGAVGIFPEGTRSKTGRMGRALEGVGMIAAKGKAPIMPVAIVTEGKRPQPFKRTVIRYGTLIDAPAEDTKEAYSRVTAQAMEQITALLEKGL